VGPRAVIESHRNVLIFRGWRRGTVLAEALADAVDAWLDDTAEPEETAMEAIGLIVLGVVLVVIAAAWTSRRRRSQRCEAVSQGVRCPLHGDAADVTVLTDPGAPPAQRHLDVVACSLLSNAAIALPARRGYLPDAPACEVLLDGAVAHPVYATEVACPRSCLHVFNAAAAARPQQPLTCASGVSDGIELMSQVDRRATGCQSFWSASS
jgi:hypothetical protein